MKIIIAGGGISGVLSAYYLLEGGAKDVVLLESASEVASKASGANAAQLSYTYVNPIGQPSLFRSFLPILTGQKPGMQIKKWQPYLLLWGMRLLANSTTRAFERNRGKLLNLSLESRANMEALLEKTGITFQGFSRGKLQVYPDAEGFAEAAAFAQHLKETYGIEQALPGLAQTCELAGDIHLKADAFAGAVYSDIDLTADCKVFCQDLLAYLQKHYPGFTVHFDQKIASIEHKGHIKGIRTHNDTYEGDRYLLCTGAGTRALLGKPLFDLPIYPVKGYTLVFHTKGKGQLKCSMTDHAQKIVFVPHDDDTLLVSGMFHFAGNDTSHDPKVIAHMLKCATYRLPWLDTANYEVRCGLRPCTPDSQPIIGRYQYDNLYVNSGHGMFGWTLAAGAAKRTANLLLST